MGIKVIGHWRENDEREGKGANVPGEIKEKEQKVSKRVKFRQTHAETNESKRGPRLKGQYSI